MDSFSPNMLKTYECCPRKYYFKYIEKISVPTSPTLFEKGKKIHALANYFLQGVNISRIETELNEDEKLIWASLLNNPFFQKDYYKSEYSVSYKLEDYWIGGRIDAVVYDAMGYFILDYKTGKIPKTPEYDYQTMVYLLSLSELLRIDNISFVYIGLKEKKNYVIKYTKALENDYKSMIKNICDEITNDSEYCCNYENCKNCEFSKFCN